MKLREVRLIANVYSKQEMNTYLHKHSSRRHIFQILE